MKTCPQIFSWVCILSGSQGKSSRLTDRVVDITFLPKAFYTHTTQVWSFSFDSCPDNILFDSNSWFPQEWIIILLVLHRYHSLSSTIIIIGIMQVTVQRSVFLKIMFKVHWEVVHWIESSFLAILVQLYCTLVLKYFDTIFLTSLLPSLSV